MVIKSITSMHFHLEINSAIYNALNSLEFIVRRDIIRRDVALSLFEATWKQFRAGHREELLIPFGKALAWSLVLNGRRSDASRLLQQIWDGFELFSPSTGRSPTYQPVRELLKQLLPPRTSAKNTSTDILAATAELSFKRQFEALPVVTVASSEITWQRACDVCLDNIDLGQLLRNGVLFKGNAMVVKYNHPPDLEAWPMLPEPEWSANYVRKAVTHKPIIQTREARMRTIASAESLLSKLSWSRGEMSNGIQNPTTYMDDEDADNDDMPELEVPEPASNAGVVTIFSIDILSRKGNR
jgi:hypothetical protein